MNKDKMIYRVRETVRQINKLINDKDWLMLLYDNCFPIKSDSLTGYTVNIIKSSGSQTTQTVYVCPDDKVYEYTEGLHILILYDSCDIGYVSMLYKVTFDDEVLCLTLHKIDVPVYQNIDMFKLTQLFPDRQQVIITQGFDIKYTQFSISVRKR